MKTKIYALRENHYVRYVGRTVKSLEYRLAQHLGAARRGDDSHRGRGIRKMLSEGRLPTITLITVANGNGDKEEMAWIAYFRSHEIPLWNETEGGEGCVPTNATRRKICARLREIGWKPCALAIESARVANQGCKRSPNVGLKISKKLTNRIQTPEHIANAKAGRNAVGVNEVFRTQAFRDKMRRIVTAYWAKRRQDAA